MTIRQFQKNIWEYYTKHKRDLPWRRNTTPYRVLVSEIMLQQTQVPRVIIKFKEFIKVFPTFAVLAKAPVRRLLRVWQGLGYNRRALLLQRCAQEVAVRYNGELPATIEELDALPGIGPATAAAVMAYAFNQGAPYIETNIRSVFIHFFFKNQKAVHDKQLMPLIEQALDYRNPGEWYAALMDYGTMLKKTVGNPNRQSRHYTKQSKFEGSDRQLRGEIIRLAVAQPKLSVNQIIRRITGPVQRTKRLAAALAREGLLS